MLAENDNLPICLTPRRVDAVVFTPPAERPRTCAQCKIKKPAEQFSVSPGPASLRINGLPCRARLCTVCERAAFAASLRPYKRVFLRETVEKTDAFGNPEYAPPGTPVTVEDVVDTEAGRTFYCQIRVCRTVKGREKRVTAFYTFKADHLCKTRDEGLAIREGARK